MAEFTTPAFLQNVSTDDWFKLIESILPEDIDLSAGNHAWNFTRPTALVAAEICEFILPEVLKLCLPEYSYGSFLNGHASSRGIVRRNAMAANGKIVITGAADSVIPAGSLFSTASVNDEPSVDYETMDEVTIPAEGTVTVEVQCTQAGTVGNTAANTVVMVASKLTGVTAVTNPEAITGGTEEEDDASLIIRILEYDQSQGDSYTGCPADYKRWATSVPGVGEATIISAQDDSGLVRIILTDANGAPATESLCESVYNYIMRPDAPGERRAPVNAYLKVVPPATMSISIKATVELDAGASIESVRDAFASQLAVYLPVALDEGEIKYTRIAAALAATDGAYDFNDLEIGVKAEDGSIEYSTSNILISDIQLPEIAEEDLILTEGLVHGTTPGIGSGSTPGAGAGTGSMVVSYATLDADGKINASQLPNFVDDVVEGYYHNGKFYADEVYTAEITGATGKIYVDIASNKQYRFDGSGYVVVGGSVDIETMTDKDIADIYDES